MATKGLVSEINFRDAGFAETHVVRMTANIHTSDIPDGQFFCDQRPGIHALANCHAKNNLSPFFKKTVA